MIGRGVVGSRNVTVRPSSDDIERIAFFAALRWYEYEPAAAVTAMIASHAATDAIGVAIAR
jgi:hypothetical protein